MKKHLTKLFAVFLVTFVAILMMGVPAFASWVIAANPDPWSTLDTTVITPNHYVSNNSSLYLYVYDRGVGTWTIYNPNGEYTAEYKGVDTVIPNLLIIDDDGRWINPVNIADDFNYETRPTQAEKHYVVCALGNSEAYYTITPPTEPYRLYANDGDATQGNDIWYYPDGTLMTNCFRISYASNGKREKQYLNENGRYDDYTGWIQVDGDWYYIVHDGYVTMGDGYDTGNGVFYFDEEGRLVTNQWVKDSWNANSWCYIGSDGLMVMNAWVDGYYIDDDGKMVTGCWYKINNAWYYFNKDGKYVKNTMVDGYYLGSDGKLVANTWAKINNRWYYFGSDGKKLTNSWVKSGGAWYYLGSDGTMTTNSWVKSGGAWYYLGSDGAMLINSWVKSGGKWYYVGSNGTAQANTWVKTNGKWYYLNGNGNPVTNTRIYYKGKYYRFNSAGVCVG